jgi:O-antigen/teichoic acid export membrane protein
MSAALALYVLTQVISHVNAMITVAAGKMQYWMTISVATGVITILLAYILGKNHGLQWVMVSIAIVEIPSALFLIHRSFGCMLMEYGRVWREAIVPTFYASVPLAIWVGGVTIADLEREFSGLVACIATYVLIWAVSSYVFGINSVERAFVRSKMNLV